MLERPPNEEGSLGMCCCAHARRCVSALVGGMVRAPLHSVRSDLCLGEDSLRSQPVVGNARSCMAHAHLLLQRGSRCGASGSGEPDECATLVTDDDLARRLRGSQGGHRPLANRVRVTDTLDCALSHGPESSPRFTAHISLEPVAPSLLTQPTDVAPGDPCAPTQRLMYD